MDRRELLRLSALLLGGALSASCTRAILSGDELRGATGGTQLKEEELQKASRIADLIIPRTETAGAIDAGVPGFIHSVVTQWQTPDERNSFIQGLAEVDTLSQRRFGRDFLAADVAEQVAVLRILEERPGPNANGTTAPASFFATIKELTVVGYYTSEIGSQQELLYRPVPGAYRGDALFDDSARQIAM